MDPYWEQKGHQSSASTGLSDESAHLVDSLERLAGHIHHLQALLPTLGELHFSHVVLCSSLPGAAAPRPTHRLATKTLSRKDVENRTGDKPFQSSRWLWCSWSCGLMQLDNPADYPVFLHHVSPSLSCSASQVVPCYPALCSPGVQNIWDYFIQH